MKKVAHHYLITLPVAVFLIAGIANAESLRCKGDIVDIGDTKAEVIVKCGQPELIDSFCEKSAKKIRQQDGSLTLVESCENVDIWTYNPGKGQFWTNLYFAEGQLREMRYGDRVK
jgi:hypothetical protein